MASKLYQFTAILSLWTNLYMEPTHEFFTRMGDDELLRAALQGGEDAWQLLSAECRDRSKAHRLANLLAHFDSPDSVPACAWADVLVSLHPELSAQLIQYATKTANRRQSDDPRQP